VEGNDLLLDTGAWRGLREIWDLAVKIDVPLTVLRTRLVARWLDHGLPRDAALAMAQGNDLPNAQYVIAHSRTADLSVGIASLS
jgi:pantothenate kinase